MGAGKLICFAALLALAACQTTTGSDAGSDVYVINSGTSQAARFDDFKITREEAKTHACSQSVLEVGASPEDCQCAEDKLFELGQDGKALADLEAGMTELSGDPLLTDIKPPRVTAIEIIRIDAFDACGFFEDGHPVGQGL